MYVKGTIRVCQSLLKSQKVASCFTVRGVSLWSVMVSYEIGEVPLMKKWWVLICLS